MSCVPWLWLVASCAVLGQDDPVDRTAVVGPAYSRFRLTLEAGERTQLLGPLWNQQAVWPEILSEDLGPSEWPGPEALEDPAVVSRIARTFTLSPLFSYYTQPSVDAEFFDLLYPVVTYDRYGTESRFQIFQVISLSGGADQEHARSRTYTLFPFLFARRSENPAENYTALWPFYGRMEKRLFRDETKFLLWPLYVQTRKADVVTDNYVAPFVHVRQGDGLKGWQFWPFAGHEVKTPTVRTNTVGELIPVPDHEKLFVMWPFYAKGTSGLGTTNEMTQRVFLPFYSFQRSPARDSSTYFWPFGVTLTDDREIGYRQTSVLWPVYIRARGEGKYQNRLWPVFGYTRYEELTSRFFLWPAYAHREVQRGPLHRDIRQVGLVLYNSVRESNSDTGRTQGRTGLWPLFLWQEDWEGREQFQIFAPLETLMPKNPSIARLYSPIWALWRSEKHHATEASSQSLLWNLYRRERTPERRKVSFLFGLFQHERSAAGSRWRLFYIPIGGKKEQPSEAEAARAEGSP